MADRFTYDVTVQYRDLDPNNHVNNAVYASYLEEARIAYHSTILERTPDEYSLVLANLEIDFERPVHHAETVTVTVETVDLGTSSWSTEYELFVDETRMATAAATVVHVDPGAGTPRAIPDDVRRAIVDFEDLD